VRPRATSPDTPPALAPQPESSGTVAATAPEAQPADRFFLARDLILAGKYQVGLTAMQALDKGDNADVAAYVGLAYNKLGRASDAKTWYEKALAIDPNHVLSMAYYGMLRAEQGDVSSAQGYLDKIKAVCGGTGCYEYAALQAVIASRRR
jgi:Flp pilus assembly protein TadD